MKDDRIECMNCERKFAPDRIEKHELNCVRQATSKRKVFNAAS